MNTREIDKLLDSYYEGNTTLEEEQILQAFFCDDDVPAGLRQHQRLFRYYTIAKTENLENPDFEKKLNARLDARVNETPVLSHIPSRNRFLFFGSVAAGILLLAGLFFTLQNDVLRINRSGTLLSPQEQTYAEARQALLLVSANFNRGIKQAERIQLIDKAFRNVELFNKFYQYQTIIINTDPVHKQSINSKKP
ncbi:MAG: hypothetical protein WCI71_12660 [Bacteroidota bacterium]